MATRTFGGIEVMPAREFLRTKILALAAQAGRLARMDHAAVGIRPQDRPYAPSAAHFKAANQRLRKINGQVRRRLAFLQRTWQTTPVNRVLVHIALVERELDRARRAFGLFFELFSQRGTTFAPALAAYDAIAQDCYAAIRAAAPNLFRGPLLKPLCLYGAWLLAGDDAPRDLAEPLARGIESISHRAYPLGSR